jgi:uncharacterized membrane protein
LPGKRPVAHTVLLLLTSFVLFTAAGSGLAAQAARAQSLPIASIGILIAVAGIARWLRLATGVNKPLEFEDELPESSYGLRLNS